MKEQINFLDESDEDVINTSSLKNKSYANFNITPEDLENIMNLYKERDEEYQDLNYFENNSIDNLLQSLQTDKKDGIISTENREEIFGSNKVFIEPIQPFIEFVKEALGDLMIQILCVSAIVQIVLGIAFGQNPKTDWIDGFSIVVAIVVVVLVGSITNYKKELKFHELNDIQKDGTRYNVIRSGILYRLKEDEILVGDLIHINYGDIMPADILLIEGNNIKFDESALTGESDNVGKEIFEKCLIEKKEGRKPHSNLILSGTNCIEGNGKGIVIAVGDHSQKGIIRRTVDNAQEDNQTPLEKKLNVIAENIGWFGMGAAIVTFIALGIFFIINLFKDKHSYDIENTVLELIKIYDQNNNIQNNPISEPDSDTMHKLITTEIDNPYKNIPSSILDIIMLCVAIIVVAIPEGLPLAVTLSLAFSIKKLMDNNNLVRRMHACETMGGANYICTDKTGTLTKNEMKVYNILNPNGERMFTQNLEIQEIGSLKKKKKNNSIFEKQIREDPKFHFDNEKYWNVLKESIALNVECTIKKLSKENINGDLEEIESKNKTDKAFIDFLLRFKTIISNEREKYFENSENYKIFPFDSQRKRMTTLIKSENFPTGYRLYTKGGAENSINYCSYFINPSNGEIEELTDYNKNFLKETTEKFNKNKLRTLYTCYKDISKEEYENFNESDTNGLLIDQKDLIFISIFGLRDSLRDGVKEAVLKCQEASVNVIMVTGDNLITATAIAKDCNILGNDVDIENLTMRDIEMNPNEMNQSDKKNDHIYHILNNTPRAITGNTFYNIIGGLMCENCKKDTNKCKCPKTEAEAEEIAKKFGEEQKKVKKDVVKNMENFEKIYKRLRVIARSQPIHKYALVLGLKQLNFVVAVTGDGTNDAPALSKSDVGFAMFAGTDIAKEASDIVILDNNFSSIVTAIIYGRNIYDNIRKFLQFQLSVNFCACLLVFICACIGNETPLTPIQMLWVNLIMDSLGSLALATEPPYLELLKRKPTKKDESIINLRMWKHIIFQSMFQLLLLLYIYLKGPTFIKEDNLERKRLNEEILHCYGILPGNVKNSEYIIYGTQNKWDNTEGELNNNLEECFKFAEYQNLHNLFDYYNGEWAGSTHMTFIFNVFVIYTLLNQFNCRVINDEINICTRILNSPLFPLITFGEMLIQILISQFGSFAFHCVSEGMTMKQWLLCFELSFSTFFVSFFVKIFSKILCKKGEKYFVKSIKKISNMEDFNALKKVSVFMPDDEIYNDKKKGFSSELISKEGNFESLPTD